MADSMVSEKWYRVCLNTIVRAGEELDSERLRILPMGSRVCVVEAAKNNGRRVRIKSPIQGWCSMSSSNGDTILAPIEDPNGDAVPPTPKNISAKVNALQERRDKQKKLLEKSQNDEAFKGKVNADHLQKEIQHLEKRVQEAELQQKERNKVFEAEEEAKGDYNNNDILICANSIIGVVRWQGTDLEGEKIIGLEVQAGAGDCDGTHAASNKRYFKVEAASGQYVKSKDVKSVLSTISVLSKLENTINELSVTRKKYVDLASRVEAENRTGVVNIFIDEN